MKKIQRLPQAFGKIIAEERARKNLSQEQLAEAIEATNVYICLLETGQRQPSLNATILIANALGIHPSELLNKVTALLDT